MSPDHNIVDALLSVWGAMYVFWAVYHLPGPPDPTPGFEWFGGYEAVAISAVIGVLLLAGATGYLPRTGFALLGVHEVAHLMWLVFYGPSLARYTFIWEVPDAAVGGTIVIVAVVATVLFARGLAEPDEPD